MPGLDPLKLAGSALHVRRALLPLPLVDRPERFDPDVLPPFKIRPIRGLRGNRVGVVASSGSGACVSLVGVARAFEEAGLEPAGICACSASVLWGAMWAAGLEADAMAAASLSWRPQNHLGIQWTRLPRFGLSAVRGFTGLAKADALESLLGRRFWHMTAGETSVPFRTAVYNLDRTRVEYFGSEETPDLTLGELARIAVAPPAAAEAVRVEGELYVDGGSAQPLPAEPPSRGGYDRVFAVNVHPSQQSAPAVVPIEPVGERERRRLGFYDLFLDRRDWPRFIRQGYEAASRTLRATA